MSLSATKSDCIQDVEPQPIKGSYPAEVAQCLTSKRIFQPEKKVVYSERIEREIDERTGNIAVKIRMIYRNKQLSGFEKIYPNNPQFYLIN